MNTIPAYKAEENYHYQPHVVLLGAGASLAAFPNGDKYGKKLPLMNDLVKHINLEPELNALGYNKHTENFETIFNDLSIKYPKNKHMEIIKDKIYNYFSSLMLPDELTLYDKLVLSLREKDLIATFNWDPFLGLAFQRNRHIKKLPKIAFLHGNVFIGMCEQHKTTGFTNCACSKCGERFKKVSLLYPIKDKDYTKDEFIKREWELLENNLKYAYLITIFGYSAPNTDFAAREIMSKVWKENKTRNFGQIEIVDIKEREEVKQNWSSFFIRNHYRIIDIIDKSYLFYNPRRSCEAFASATLFNEPWGNLTNPQIKSLKEYQEWILEIIKSEILHEKNKLNPLSKW